MGKDRVLSGDGRWMIPAPPGYQGKTYIKGIYVYEHRFLMEQKVGRLLSTNEVVHHINGNKLDNRIKNMQLKSRGGHTSHHSKPKKTLNLKCSFCRKDFIIELRNYKVKIKQGQRDFYCSRSCGASGTRNLHKLADSSVGRADGCRIGSPNGKPLGENWVNSGNPKSSDMVTLSQASREEGAETT